MNLVPDDAVIAGGRIPLEMDRSGQRSPWRYPCQCTQRLDQQKETRKKPMGLSGACTDALRLPGILGVLDMGGGRPRPTATRSAVAEKGAGRRERTWCSQPGRRQGDAGDRSEGLAGVGLTHLENPRDHTVRRGSQASRALRGQRRTPSQLSPLLIIRENRRENRGLSPFFSCARGGGEPGWLSDAIEG